MHDIMLFPISFVVAAANFIFAYLFPLLIIGKTARGLQAWELLMQDKMISIHI